jgi:chaperone protein EcpD
MSLMWRASSNGSPLLLARRAWRWAVLLTACIAPGADAALAVVGTRFIYPGDDRRMVVMTRNLGAVPILVQAWLDDGRADVDPSLLRVPFMIAPPLARIEPGQSLALSVQSLRDELARDRESLFWINLIEVPPTGASSDRTLRVVHRLRMKLLYRPPRLDGHAGDAPAQLRWRAAAARLSAFNPTPYYVTLTRVVWRGVPLVLTGGMVDVAPFGQAEMDLPGRAGPGPDARCRAGAGCDEAGSGAVGYDAVGDDGTRHEYEGRLAPP